MNTLKVVLLGDSAVGKTSLVKRYVYDSFENSECMTIGASFFNKKIIHKYKDKEQQITLQIWDTAGQERFRSMIPLYVRNTQVALIVFDSRNIDDIKEYFYRWLKFIKEYNNDNILIYLVGSKRDLIKLAEIDRDILNELNIPRHNICFVSSKTGQFINELFSKILDDIIENNIIINTYENINNEQKINLTNDNYKYYYCCYK